MWIRPLRRRSLHHRIPEHRHDKLPVHATRTASPDLDEMPPPGRYVGGMVRQVERRVAAFREESGSGVPVQVVQVVRGP